MDTCIRCTRAVSKHWRVCILKRQAAAHACRLSFFLPGAMAEEEALAPENEYVAARYTTLQGNEQMLFFPRGAALGAFFL